LISNGGSILCVTHDSLIGAYADHIIELGPEGGQKVGILLDIKNYQIVLNTDLIACL